MPEVSLVAILDADKEGFLRSERSLIQTIGRAARNINGTAILYADKITGSIERAVSETDRRRDKQLDYNKLHNITPRGIHKQVTDVMDVGYSRGSNNRVRRIDRVAEEMRQYDQLSTKQLNGKLQKLENQMYEHARNLEFEEAAKLRDQIAQFKDHFFKNPMLSGRSD